MLCKAMYLDYDDDAGAMWLLCICDLFDDDDDVIELWRWCGNSATAQFMTMLMLMALFGMVLYTIVSVVA